MQPVHLAAVKPEATGANASGPSAPPARSGCATCSTRARCWRSAPTGPWPAPTRGWDSPPRAGGPATLLPEQALTAHEALAGYTLAPAHAVGEEAVAGRIRVGMRADLTGLAADPVDAPASDLPDHPVWLTVVGGRVVHQGEVVNVSVLA